MLKRQSALDKPFFGLNVETIFCSFGTNFCGERFKCPLFDHLLRCKVKKEGYFELIFAPFDNALFGHFPGLQGKRPKARLEKEDGPFSECNKKCVFFVLGGPKKSADGLIGNKRPAAEVYCKMLKKRKKT